MSPDNFEYLIIVLQEYRDREISIKQLKQNIKQINGLGLSTITKFTNFLNTKINGCKAVIFDDQVLKAINTGRFEEFTFLAGIKTNAIQYYESYIERVNSLSYELKVKPEQIEVFLFLLGRNLSEKIGEEGDYSEL